MSPCLAGILEQHRAVFLAGHEWWIDRERWSVVIDMVYGDLSGDDSGVVTAACFLGREHQWLDAIAAWSRALDDADVNEFHATDFFGAHEEFDNDKWRREVPGRGMVVGGEMHEEFAERFTGIAVSHGLIGFALSIDAPAFYEFLAPEFAKEQRTYKATDPKIYVIMNCLASVARFLSSARENNQLQVIFEHEKGAGRFISFFDESKSRREQYTYWFKSFTTGPKSFLPLQMADLLAHESWRRTKSVWSPTPRPLRKSFERMIADGSVQLDVVDRALCIKNAMAVRDLSVRYPDGLIPAEDTRQ